MSLFDNALEILRTVGGGTGTVGGFLVYHVYRKFSDMQGHVLKAKKRDELLEAQNAELKSKLEIVERECRSIREEVVARLESIARGSKDIKLSLDAASEERVSRIEKRLSGVEDDFDKKEERDRESWEQIQRSLGRIEGTLGRKIDG